MVVKSLEPVFILFFKLYRFPVFTPISCIGTIFLYSYWSPISVLFSCIVIYGNDIYCTYYLTCYYMTPDSYMQSPVMLDTYNYYHNMGMMTRHLDISWHTHTHPPVQYVHLIPVLLTFLTCSCSFPYTDNYLINYKRPTYIGQGKTNGLQVVNMFTVVLGMLYNSNFRIYLRASRCPRGALTPYVLLYSWMGI